MFRSIWQLSRAAYQRRRSGIDPGSIEQLRADLRFRLAVMEYAYYGRSGRRVARCLTDLKRLLGDKAMHRYLRQLDPDLRAQFVERSQGARRDLEAKSAARPAPATRQAPRCTRRSKLTTSFEQALSPNVVPFNQAPRRSDGGPVNPAAGA